MNPTPTTPDPTTDPAELVLRFTPLARAMALRRAAAVPWLADDLLSEAMYGLWRAAVRWDVSKAGTMRFATFAIWGVRARLKRRVGQERLRNPTAFTSQTERDGDGGEVPRIDMVADRRHPDPAAAAELADEVGRLDGLLATLDAAKREQLLRYIGDDETAAVLADETGVSRQAVYDSVNRSLAKLKAAAG